MAITSIRRDWNGEVDIVRLITTDSLATVAGAGYLTAQADNLTAINSGTWTWQANDMVLVSASDGDQFFTLSTDLTTLEVYSTAGNGAVTLPVVSGNFATFDGTLGAIGDLGYLPSDAAKTRVVMAGSAVVANRIAHFVDTTGTIDDTAANVTNLGNIIAGASGTAGTLTSFPASAANGSFIWAAVGNAGNFTATVSPISSLGQASVYTIPDPGASTANFILSASAGTQTISTGNLTMSAGNLSVSGTITSVAGNITSGSAGDAGTFISFPATTANGTLILAATNAGGAFNTTITNATTGQSAVISIPDGGQTTSNFIISNSATTQTIATGNIAMTAGFMQQSVANALTAHSGGGQGSALALTRQISRVTTVAAGGDSVLLPAAVAGRVVTVINAAAANAMDVFPASGEVINALPANTALSVVANTTAIFFCAVAGTWNSVVTA